MKAKLTAAAVAALVLGNSDDDDTNNTDDGNDNADSADDGFGLLLGHLKALSMFQWEVHQQKMRLIILVIPALVTAFR